eukprot:NODE_2205_length_976_cov_281.745928.p1 GENE.NODE_2205_length_976_cov_281.745928~~NODE_2205_length_976_cov_281.745928.p1  ORF type:complete len:245 (-),score=60.04 NODE_2205_length_976_cov_281.745928:224-958(-)
MGGALMLLSQLLAAMVRAGILVVGICLADLWLCAAAAAATYNHWSAPCDQPLRWYFVVDYAGPPVLLGVVGCLLKLAGTSPTLEALIMTLTYATPLSVVAWGVYMISASETCHETNPQLYSALRAYIYFSYVCTLAVQLLHVGAFDMPNIDMLVLQIDAVPSCQAAVRKLPKVPVDAEELRDPEDGMFRECIICTMTLGGGDDEGTRVVRAPCAHYFHEPCLAAWCQNHVDCPTCRASVGAPDT